MKEMKLDYIEHGDCLELMKQLPDGSIDLTVTSPPYDNLRTYNGNISQWCFEKFQSVVKELFRITKDGGVVVWVVGDSTIKGSETGTSFKQALYFKECGFGLHDTMIFAKNNPMPNVKEKRYSQSFEYMFVFSKGAVSKFNPIMERCTYGGVMTFGCTSTWNSSGELIKKGKRKINQFKKKSNMFFYTVGSTNSKKTKHPAVFPERLATDHIITWSNPGDIVFDPFLGSGTTCVAAVKNSRHYIGFELDKHYFDIAAARIAEEEKAVATV